MNKNNPKLVSLSLQNYITTTPFSWKVQKGVVEVGEPGINYYFAETGVNQMLKLTSSKVRSMTSFLCFGGLVVELSLFDLEVAL